MLSLKLYYIEGRTKRKQAIKLFFLDSHELTLFLEWPRCYNNNDKNNMLLLLLWTRIVPDMLMYRIIDLLLLPIRLLNRILDST